jgi:hypothetical protein
VISFKPCRQRFASTSGENSLIYIDLLLASIKTLAVFAALEIFVSLIGFITFLFLRAAFRNSGHNILRWSLQKTFQSFFAITVIFTIATWVYTGSLNVAGQFVDILLYCCLPLSVLFWGGSLIRKQWKQKKIREDKSTLSTFHENPLFVLDNEVPATQWLTGLITISLAAFVVFLLFLKQHNASPTGLRLNDLTPSDTRLIFLLLVGLVYNSYHFVIVMLSEKPKLLFFRDKIVSTNKEALFRKIYKEKTIVKNELNRSHSITMKNMFLSFHKARWGLILLFFPITIPSLIALVLAALGTKLLYDLRSILNRGPVYNAFILEKDNKKDFPLWIAQEDLEKVKGYFREYWNFDIVSFRNPLL